MKQMRIEIFSEPELVDHLNTGGDHFSHCISIRNPDQQMPSIIKTSFKSILELKFYDVETVAQLGPEQKVKRVPEPKDIKGVIEYFHLSNDKATGYTIHCWQGISRSPAIALGLLYIMTNAEEMAAEILNQIRPGSRPHQKLVQYFDEELGSHLSVINAEIHRQSMDSLRRELQVQDSHLEELVSAEEGRGLLARAKAIRE
jgi:predicted protein tyrosine phosphatase